MPSKDDAPLPPTPDGRAAYAQPTLTLIGDVASLTQNVGKTAALDGGKGGMSRSAP